MSQELEYRAFADEPRVSARFIVAGIGLLLIGLCGTCTLIALPISFMTMRTQMKQPPGFAVGLAASIVLFVPLTIGAVWTGIACFLGRRWVRPIILALSGLGLIIAVPTLAGLIAAAVQSPAAVNGPLASVWISVITIVTTLVFYVGVPLAYFWIFLPAHVKHTLETLDPQSRWTDRLPVPLLGMVVATLILGVQLTTTILIPPRTALMGALLSRNAAALPMAVLMLGTMLASGWLLQKRLAGWWVAVTILMLLAVSNFVNALIFGTRIYELTLGIDVKTMRESPFLKSQTVMLVTQAIWMAVMLTAALWVKGCCLTRDWAHSEQATIGSDTSPL